MAVRLLTLARCSFLTARGGGCDPPGRPRALRAVPARRFACTLMAGARGALLQHQKGGLANQWHAKLDLKHVTASQSGHISIHESCGAWNFQTIVLSSSASKSHVCGAMLLCDAVLSTHGACCCKIGAASFE